jgi:hypothetical protein
VAVTTHRFRFLAATVVLLAPALVGCSTNFKAQTDQVYIPGRGVNDRTSTVNVLNALVVSGEAGSGRVVATLVGVTDEADELLGVTVDGTEAEITGEAEIGALGRNNLLDDAEVTAEAEGIAAGDFVEVRFTFAEAEPVTLDVPVVPPVSEFADQLPAEG